MQSLLARNSRAPVLAAKPIPAMREVDGEEAEVHMFLSPAIIRKKSAGG
jgi:hypothetical protein